MMIGRWTWAQVYAIGVGVGLAQRPSSGLRRRGACDVQMPATRARAFALAWGSTAAVLSICGFASGGPVAGLIPVNTADNYFHILDASGILVGILSAPRFASHPVRSTRR
jgi:hypothetical protein